MKALRYRMMTEVNHGTEEQPDIQQIFSDVAMGWNEVNEEIAKREAYNGEYTIEDDGAPEPAPTQLDRIESQVTYTAMMTDTLIMET